MGQLTVPPYDVIGKEDREKYLRAHPKNIVRLILPQRPSGGDSSVTYRGPAKLLSQWRREKTLILEKERAFYPYRQTYCGPDGDERSRAGFLGALALDDASPGGGALPHEKTMPGPRRDRMQLMIACRANLSPILLIHNDAEREAEAFLEKAMSSPELYDFRDELGIRHQLWRTTDRAAIEGLREGMQNDWSLIADGHHRYESSRDLLREFPDEKGASHILGFFCSLRDRGFKVFPIHRTLVSADLPPGETIRRLLESRWPLRKVAQPATLEGVLAALGEATPGTVGVVTKGDPPFLLPLTHEDGPGAPTVPIEGRVDTSLLEKEVFSGLLGLSPERTAGDRVTYTPRAEEAWRRVQAGEAAAAFLLKPMSVDAVVRAARNGVRLPQKSTYFYPKLLTGLVIRPFDSEPSLTVE